MVESPLQPLQEQLCHALAMLIRIVLQAFVDRSRPPKRNGDRALVPLLIDERSTEFGHRVSLI